jgi:tetratricopeptide (TPR) repeat protein
VTAEDEIRRSGGASRLQEINADRVAARAFGKEAFEEGLRHVIRRDVALHYQQAVAEHQLAGNHSPHSPSASTLGLSSIRAEVRRQIDVDFDKLWDIKTSEDDTHPSSTERIRLLQRLAIPSTSRTGGCRKGIRADQLADQVYEAADELRKAMALDPALEQEKGDGRAELGGILFRLGDSAAAITEYDRAIALDASRLGLYLQRGEAYFLQDLPQAEADFTRALDLDPRCAEELAGRARARSTQGRFTEAEADARQAICIEPELGSLKDLVAIRPRTQPV